MVKKARKRVFTNTRKKGALEVAKAVVSSNDADENLEFTFTVTLSGFKC